MKTLKTSILNLKRNRLLNLASILSIALILVILNVLLTANFIVQDQIQNLTNKINLNIYIENTVKNDNITQLMEFLQGLPEVQEVTKTSNHEALQLIQKQYPNSSDFLTEFNIDNPLPHTVHVKTHILEDQTKVLNKLQQSPFKNLISKSENKEEYNKTITHVVNNLLHIKTFSVQIILWIIITFLISGTLIIFNAIKTALFTRRNEIQIMQFVGATFTKIMTPFILEGVFIGMLGFTLNLAILFGVNELIPFSNFFNNIDIVTLTTQLIGAILLGVIASSYVVYKYLNTKEIFND